MADRIKITLSIPSDFIEKFTNFINNINMLNSDKELPIIIEEVKTKIKQPDKFAAVPNKEDINKEGVSIEG